MVILNKKYTIKELYEINSFPNGFVKGVVDLDKELVALDAEMHYELADYLKEQRNSKESDMWGFNLWLENQSMDSSKEVLEDYRGEHYLACTGEQIKGYYEAYQYLM